MLPAADTGLNADQEGGAGDWDFPVGTKTFLVSVDV
jgi:hypothetical protein